MNSFFRLLRYAKPYKGRLAWAVLAMVVYAVASALRRLSDQADPRSRPADPRRAADRSPSRSSALYFVKGIGSYFSGYLMEDVGQRVVMDLRDRLYGHILGTVGELLRAQYDGTAAVARVERRRTGAARGVGDRRRSAAGIAGARRLCGHPVLDTTRVWRSSA